MATISQKIPNLIGGVSQQADAFKLAGQLRSCTNYFPDPAFGLIKRPGLKAIGGLSGAVGTAAWFFATRDDQERYIIQFAPNGVPKIWDADSGVAKTINTPAASATTYATHTSPTDLELLQINDYYFVLNKKVVTKMATGNGTSSAAKVNYAFVNVNTIGGGLQYSIVLNNTPYTVTTTNNHVGLNTVLNGFADTGVGINATGTGFTAEKIGNSIYITKNDGAAFDIKASGGSTGSALEAYRDEVPSITVLPKQFRNGAILKVSGDKTVNGDDYYVKFVTSNGENYGAGVWKETIGPSVPLKFDATTMPHALIREANGTFTFRNLDSTAVTQTATITGVPQTITITNNTFGQYQVGESFAVSGGTGKDLRLEVTSTTTRTVTTTSTNVSTTDYVSRYTVATTGYTGRGSTVTYSYRYDWYVGGVKVATTTNLNAVIIGNRKITQTGAFTAQVGTNPAKSGIQIVDSFPNAIDGIKIVRAGQGYTANNVVTSDRGDTFTITAVGNATGTVDEIANQYWNSRVVGDLETNPNPTFIGYPISGINFFKNRLIFFSNDNVICSQAGSYFDFFASTVITIVDSDPIDISCGSQKPVQLTHALQVPRGLMLFADNAQYILETSTEAFSPSTAEINLVSKFSQDATISPLDSGNSFMILDQTVRAASIREMLVTDSSTKPQTVEITRTIPSYIPGDVISFKGSTISNTLAILSLQERNAIYLYRWLVSQDKALMNSWFKWILPGTISLVDFDNEHMYVVTNQPTPFLSKINLVTESSSGALLYDGTYVDTRLDLYDYNPVKVYLSGTDQTKLCFKEEIESFTGTAVAVSLDPQNPGLVNNLPLQFDDDSPAGQRYFVLVDGNQTSLPWALGVGYEAEATLPALYYKPSENASDTLNIPTIYRIDISSYNSGPYSVKVSADGREEYLAELPQITANQYLAQTLPMLRNPTNTIPIMAKADQVDITIKADYPLPTAITSLTWQGSFTTRGVLRQ
jgi:hypothetical protein